MKKLALTIILCLFSVIISKAQTYDFLSPDLKRMTSNRGIQINPLELEAYLYFGKKVEPSEVMNYLMKVEYQTALYSDSDNTPKVIVFEQASQEAIAAKIKMFEMAPGSDFLVGETPSDFTLKSLEGQTVNLQDYKGQIVLLNFWFVGCKPCIMEMPELNDIVADFESEGVNFLAIGLDNPERVNKFLETNAFEYHLLPNGRRVANQFGVTSYPTHLLLNREGKVIFSQVGYFPGLQYALRKRLKDALEEK